MLTEHKEDDVPLISLNGYALTHDEVDRMVKNCAHELEEARNEIESLSKRDSYERREKLQ